MWVMARNTVALRSRVLDLCFFDLLGLVRMAGDAQGLRVGIGQDDFPVLRGSVADFAGLIRERRMRELLQQFGFRRLVRIVALNAVRIRKRLVGVCLLQRGILRVVTIEAKTRSRLGQMEVEFLLSLFAGLVGRMAGLAAHVERRMAAALLGNVDPDVVATQAEVFFLTSRGRLQKLILVVARVRIVTLHAITHCGTVHGALDVGRILIRMAGQAQARRRGRDQLDPRDVFVNANLVTAGAAHRDRRVNGLAFALFRVAFQALGGICVFVEWDRVRTGENGERTDE